MDITDELIKKIDIYLKNTLSAERYNHSISTAKTAEKLCKLFNIDEKRGYVTGLIHDIARELEHTELFALAEKYEENIVAEEEAVILHGMAGAVMAKDMFSIADNEILKAIAQHTTGEPRMSRLAKVIFIADHIEPLREHITDKYINSLSGKNLDNMFEIVLNYKVDYLKAKAKKISKKTLELLEEINERKK
jgi:nicotinate-nucleotide adenylyltransferase